MSKITETHFYDPHLYLPIVFRLCHPLRNLLPLLFGPAQGQGPPGLSRGVLAQAEAQAEGLEGGEAEGPLDAGRWEGRRVDGLEGVAEAGGEAGPTEQTGHNLDQVLKRSDKS